MSDGLMGLVPFYIGAGTWHAYPGVMYLCDTTHGAITLKLLPVDSLPADAYLAFKGVIMTHTITLQPASGEKINGVASLTARQPGWGREVCPGAPAGAAAGKGWMSF